MLCESECDDYQVEGEVGRFRLVLYQAVDAAGTVVCRGATAFPRRQPREWHQTEGFREEALCLGASKRSYRDLTAPLNRSRRQVPGGTSVMTLQANAQQEGAQVLMVASSECAPTRLHQVAHNNALFNTDSPLREAAWRRSILGRS
jgi:hypothetical protein